MARNRSRFRRLLRRGSPDRPGDGARTVKGAATPIVLGVAMIATAIGVQWLQPEALPATDRATLAQSIPLQFGDWKEVAFTGDQIDPGKGTADEPNMDRPYDDLLMRAYGN